MGQKCAALIYFIITFLWTTLTFIVLLPDVKNLAYSKCVWHFEFAICDKFFGIEGGYRFTISVTIFFMTLGLITLNFNSVYAEWVHKDCWLLKILLLAGSNLIGFLVPFTRQFMVVLYYMMLTGAIIFTVVLFTLVLDASHAFKLFWLRKAKANMDIPTCYMCTWLFVLHLVTSLLYAISVDLILAVVFFNNINDCVKTFIYGGVNVGICFLAFGISYFPTLRDRQCATQIIFSAVLAVTCYTTWIALSDPGNEYCNMFGTIFTGSLLDTSVSFKSLVSIVVAIPPLLFTCFRQDMVSFTRSLITNSTATDSSWYIYTNFHMTMALASCFMIMSITNYYQPVYNVFRPLHKTFTPIRTSVKYFEGYNQARFVLLLILGTFIPLFYLTLLITRLVKDCIDIRKEKKRRIEEEQELRKAIEKENSKLGDCSCIFNASNEFLYVKISWEKALQKLQRRAIHDHGEQASSTTNTNLGYILLQCFRITDTGLSYWHFPKNISQTYFKGRNGSNACTIIAMIFGRYFARSEISFQETGYLHDTLINLYYKSIEEGSQLYDSLVKDLGVLDLSIEEVTDRFGAKLNVRHILPSLAVSFQDDVESATVLHQLQRMIRYQRKQVVLFIHKFRTSAFLIYDNENILYADSHSFGNNGALLIACTGETLPTLVEFLHHIFGRHENRLCSLTQVEYEERWGFHKPFK